MSDMFYPQVDGITPTVIRSDDCISRQAAINAICRDKCELSAAECISGIDGECTQIKMIKDLPAVRPKAEKEPRLDVYTSKDIPARKWVATIKAPVCPTNGEMMMALFPDAELEDSQTNISFLVVGGLAMVSFDKEWWNAPYEGGKTETERRIKIKWEENDNAERRDQG